nr:hypothetical protein [Tanacetum cinerariifolium]
FPAGVEEAHVAHDVVSNLHCPLLKDKLKFMSFDELVDVFDVHALQMVVVEYMDMRSEDARVLEEMPMLRNVAASAEDSQRELSEEMNGLRSEEVAVLSSKLKAATLKKTKFVKDFLPSVIKKLFQSEHVNQDLGDLQQKPLSSQGIKSDFPQRSNEEKPDQDTVKALGGSTATIRNFTFLGASGKGPIISIPHWMKGYAAVTDVISCLAIHDTSEWIWHASQL